MSMFIGIPLAEAARVKLSRTVAVLSLPENDFRRSRPQGWHITLQFLGNVTQEQFECLLPRLAQVSVPSLPIQIRGLDLIGPSIVAARVEPSSALHNLFDQVAGATREYGFRIEDRPWRPHITLARAKARANRAAMARVRAMRDGHPARFECEFVAEEFFLYESFTEAQGPRYEVRARFPLTVSPQAAHP